MKYLGLERDLNNEDIPENFGIDAKNGVNSKIKGAAINEGGFKVYQKSGVEDTYKYGLECKIDGTFYKRRPIGEIFIDDGSFIIFSLGYITTNTISGEYSFNEIGYLTKDKEYIALYNDLSNTDKLEFNPSFPFTGEFTRNYLGEIIIIATDNNSKPLYFNLTKALITAPITTFNLNDMLMFPNINLINTSITVNDTGGSLENGVYYLSYIYENEDYSINTTNVYDNPISIFNTQVGNNLISFKKVKGDLELNETSKSITVNLTNVNTNFKKLKVLAIIKRNGITTAKYIKEININSDTLNFTIINANQLGGDISLKEALTPSVRFNKVYKFAQVYNRLYAAIPSVNSLRTFQKYANLVDITWVSKLIEPLGNGTPAKSENNHDNKTFLHKEVYAFYIHLVLNDGTITEGFHIPYNRLNTVGITAAGYRDTYNTYSPRTRPTAAHNQELGDNTPKFRLEDTCTGSTGDGINGNGEFGFWENENELYPNTEDWDSSGLVSTAGFDGQDLRGQKVRHHRFPSINWMKQNIYNGDNGDDSNEYGTKKLDQLGIFINGVTIPSEIQPFVKSWFISYAQRDYDNSTVVGQSIVLYESSCTDTRNQGGSTYPNMWFNGLNIKMRGLYYTYGGTSAPIINAPFSPDQLGIGNQSILRFYDLGLIKRLIDINPTYISNELLLKTTWDYNNVYHCDGTQVENGDNAASFYMNYIEKSGATSESTHNLTYSGSPLDVRYRKLNLYKYLISNAIDNQYLNQTLEDTLLLDIKSNNSYQIMPINYNNTMINWFYNATTWLSDIRPETYLTTLMNMYDSCYLNLDTQKLINTGIYFPIEQNYSNYLYKGDGFTNYYAFHTGGWGGCTSNQLYINATHNGGKEGVHTLYTHVCETTTNLALRSSDNTKPSYKFYPESAAEYTTFIPREEIHTNTLYNEDYSSINNLSSLIPYQINKKFADIDYYKINRSIAQQSESTDIGWRTWLVNDYYIAPRNKGKIHNIDALDRTLIIHTENTILFTVGTEQLNVDGASAFIGAGNIFERPAYELSPSKEGTFGTKHKFSCIVTPVGYLSIDAERGLISIISKEGVEIISNHGLRRWLYNHLKYETRLFYNDTQYIDIVDDNPYTGFGFTVGYDSEFNRLIIAKKVYELTEAGKALLNDGDVLYVNNRFISTDGYIEITFENSTYFKNKSFTLSFDLDAKRFTYFHDYFPNKIFNSRISIFCFKEKDPIAGESQDNRLFILNQDNKGIYDNTTIIDVDNGSESAVPFSFYVVPVINHSKATMKATNVSWITRVFTNDNGQPVVLPQETFDKILAFNSYQATTIIDLTNFNFGSYFNSNVRNIKNEWFFNKLRDQLYSAIYNTGYAFITDYSVLNPADSIDVNKPFEETRPLEDKWLAVKLEYTNTSQKEIHLLQFSCIFALVNR